MRSANAWVAVPSQSRNLPERFDEKNKNPGRSTGGFFGLYLDSQRERRSSKEWSDCALFRFINDEKPAAAIAPKADKNFGAFDFLA